MQTQHNRGKTNFRRGIVIGFFAFLLMSVAVGATIQPARALFGVADLSTTIGDIPRQIGDIISKNIRRAGSIAFKKGVHTFLSQIAYRSATYLASGGRGQGPLFEEFSFGKLVEDAGDAAVGDALETLFVEGTRHCIGGPMDGKSCTTNAECKAFCSNTEDCYNISAAIDDPNGDKYNYDAIDENGVCQGGFGTSLCNIDPKIKVDIHASVSTTARNAPTTAKCKWSDIQRNAERIGSQVGSTGGLSLLGGNVGRDLNRRFIDGTFDQLFDAGSNNFGQYFTILSQTEEQQAKAQEQAKNDASIDTKGVTSTITGKVKTPAFLTKTQIKSSIDKAGLTETTQTGDIFADAFNIFTSTLSSKLLQSIFVTGFNPNADVKNVANGSGENRFSFSFGSGRSGRAAAQAKFASLAKPSFGGGGALDLLSDFTVCPDGIERGPTNCVLAPESFWVNAIRGGMRLQEAVEQSSSLGGSGGIGDDFVGFGPDGKEITTKEGLPFRSLKILRRYRVIPVTWELAAQYSRDYDDPKGGQTIENLMNAFYDADSPYYQMVDPNWVLKIPPSQCRRTGYGETLYVDEQVDNDGNPDTPTSRQVQRQDNVCIDDQTCLFENDDGTCKGQYGYCTKEDPFWRFDGEQCEDYYATCRTYAKRNGGSVNYLQNTLDASVCSADNFGCQWYCKDYDASIGKFNCYYNKTDENYSDYKGANTLTTKDIAYLDANVSACTEKAVGCSAYLPEYGQTNMVENGGFELIGSNIPDDAAAPDDLSTLGWVYGNGLEATDTELLSTAKNVSLVYDGRISLKLKKVASHGPYLEYTINTGYPVENRAFALSYYGKSAEASACQGNATLRIGSGDFTRAFNYDSVWRRNSIVFTIPLTDTEVGLRIAAPTGCDIAVDDVLLEEFSYFDYVKRGGANLDFTPPVDDLETVLQPTEYADYATRNVAYLTGAAASCKPEEVGCELFTPVQTDRPQVPGIAKPADVCAADQVGCRVYEEKPYPAKFGVPDPTNVFRAGKLDAKFIASKATECSAVDVGCEEYTNVNKASKGGEALEYYSFVKQCVLPGRSDLRSYYVWEGDDIDGLQLRSFELLKSNIDTAPCTNLNVNSDPNALQCTDTPTTIATCDPATDGLDCLEYSYVDPGTGGISTFFRYRTRTITASETCEPLRNTIDGDTYYGDTTQSAVCPAAANTCREYVGNAGYNTREVLNDDFEDGTSGGWSSFIPTNESLRVSGHSLGNPDSPAAETRKDLYGEASDGKSYTIHFWAKGKSQNVGGIEVSITDAAGSKAFFAKPGGGLNGTEVVLSDTEWKEFTVGPLSLVGDYSASSLVFGGFVPGDFVGPSYLDNIQLTEVTDRLYLTKNSVDGAAACTEVGCATYTDRAGDAWNLKSFSALCKEEVVGCRAFLDTNNTTLNPFEQEFGRVDPKITVPADRASSVKFLVDKEETRCSAEEKGCKALGLPKINGDNRLDEFATVYLRDDPDQYEQIWCGEQEIGCEEFLPSGSVTPIYVKDPGLQTCEYRRPTGSIDSAWLKTGTDEPCPTVQPTNTPPGRPIGKACARACVGGDRDGLSCVNDAECGLGITCGAGAAIDVGTECATNSDCGIGMLCDYRVGVCPAEKNSCTEYRDPKDPQANCRANCPLYYDASGKAVLLTDTCETGGDVPGCRPYYYISSTIDTESPAGVVDDDVGNKLFYDTTKNLSSSSYSSNFSADGDPDGDPATRTTPTSKDGYCEGNPGVLCKANGDCPSGVCVAPPEEGTPVLCAQKVCAPGNMPFDGAICVDDAGCGGRPGSCQSVSSEKPEACDSNIIAKVRRDRQCAEWLSCKTSVVLDDPNDFDRDGDLTEDTCLELQRCRQLDPDTGQCLDALPAIKADTIGRSDDPDFQNNSGFITAGYAFDKGAYPGKYPYDAMVQAGLGTAYSKAELVPKWNFEPVAAITGQAFLKCEDGARKGADCMNDTQCPDDNGDPIDGACATDLGEWESVDSTDTLRVAEDSGNSLADGNNVLVLTANGGGSDAVKAHLGDVIFANQQYTLSLKMKVDSFAGDASQWPQMQASFHYASGDIERLGVFTPTNAMAEYVLPPINVTSANPKGAEIWIEAATDKALTLWFDDVSLKPVLEVSQPRNVEHGIVADYFKLKWEDIGDPGLDGDYVSIFSHTANRIDETIDFYEGPNDDKDGSGTLIGPDPGHPLTMSPGVTPSKYPEGGKDPFTNPTDEALSAEWVGGFFIPTSGQYTLLVNTNDGFSFFVDDTSISLFSGVGGVATKGFSAAKYFEEGWHPVKLLWDNKGFGEGGIQLGIVHGKTDYETAVCDPKGIACPLTCSTVGDTDICSPIPPLSSSPRHEGISAGDIIPKDQLTTALRASAGEYLDSTVDTNITYPNYNAKLDSVVGRKDLVFVRWTGQIHFDAAGTYQLKMKTNDGVRLSFQGKELTPVGGGDPDALWTDGAHEGVWNVTAAEGWNTVAIEYYENLGDAQAELSWDVGHGFTTIPNEKLRPPASATSGYIARSCRAYPKADATQCDVIDDNAVRYQGWKGYCIEKDPDNPNQCLTWYPIDVIAGESLQIADEAKIGYQDRVPLYYCTAASGNALPEYSQLRTYNGYQAYTAYEVDADVLDDDGTLDNDAVHTRYCGSKLNKCLVTDTPTPSDPITPAPTRRFPVYTGAGRWVNPGSFDSTNQGKYNENPGFDAGEFASNAHTGVGCDELAVYDDCGSFGGLKTGVLDPIGDPANNPALNGNDVKNYTFAVCDEAETYGTYGSVLIREKDSDSGDADQDFLYPSDPKGGYLSEDDIEGFLITPEAAYSKAKDCKAWPTVNFTRETFGKTITHDTYTSDSGTLGSANYYYDRVVVRDLSPSDGGDGDDNTVDEIHWEVRPTSLEVADPAQGGGVLDPWKNADCVDDGNGLKNCLWFRAVFNKDRKLVRYDFKGDDESGETGDEKYLYDVDDDGDPTTPSNNDDSDPGTLDPPKIGTDNLDEVGIFSVRVKLRESCQEVAKVADISGAKSWTSRVSSGSAYTLEDNHPEEGRGLYLTYGKEETAPFGAAITETGAPENWDSTPGEPFNQPLYVESKQTTTDQARAGSQTSCYGYCNYGVCAKDHSKSCTTSEECTVDAVPDTCIGKAGVCEGDRSIQCVWGLFDANNCRDHDAGERCVGGYAASNWGGYKDKDSAWLDYGWPRVESEATQRLKRLFATHMGLWRWDYKEQKYVRRAGDDTWSTAYKNMALCQGTGDPPRPTGYNDEYCGILPQVSAIKVNDSINAVTLTGPGAVKLTFNSFVDREQEPLKTIVIDWGDGTIFTIPWDQKTKPDPANPHTFEHSYLGADGVPGCGSGNCTWRPKIMIQDNWDFCNDAYASRTDRTTQCNIRLSYAFDAFSAGIKLGY